MTPPTSVALATEQVLELSLEAAIRLALQNNLDIERDRLSPQIAHTQVEQARATFDPSVALTTGLSQTKTLPTTQTAQFDSQTGDFTGTSVTRPFAKNVEVTPSFKQKIVTGGNYELSFINSKETSAPASFGTTTLIANPRYESTLSLSFTQPLLKDFGIALNTAPIRQAQNTEEIAQQQLVQRVLDTVFLVQQGYWELVFRVQDLGAKREAKKLAEDFLAENKIRVELGTLAPIELVQAETQAKRAEGDVIVAEAAVREAEDRLKETLNLSETLSGWRIRLHPTDTPPFTPVTDIPIEDKVAYAMQHRPDLVQSQLTITSQEIARDVAQNQRLPRVDLQGQASVNAFSNDAGNALGNLRDTDGYNWSFALKFSYPLGNRAANNELQKQKLLLQQALVDQRKLQRTVVRQVFQTVRDTETASKRVEVTRASTVLARTQLEAEQEKFRLGLSTSFNVLQFQTQLTTARSDETRALSDYNVALGKLDQVTGTLQYSAK
jgi:outer membrane protein TolC